MSGGTFVRCVECKRIVIYGQTCTCGNTTNGQREATGADLRGQQGSGEGLGADGVCSCGNRFDGDNFCMVSACQWEGINEEGSA